MEPSITDFRIIGLVAVLFPIISLYLKHKTFKW